MPEPARARDSGLHPVLASPDEGTLMHGRDGRIVLCNAAAERFLGLSLHQLSGKRLHEVEWQALREDGSPLPEEERPAMVTLRTGRPLDGVRVGLRRAGGPVTWLSVCTRPLRGEDEAAPWGVLAAFRRDAPGTAPALAELPTEEVVWELDYQGRTVRAQPSLEAGLGLQAPPEPSRWLELVAPEDREAVERAWQLHLEGRTPVVEVDCRMRTLDGGWRWVRHRSRVVERRPDGAPALVAGALSDVSRRRALEEQLSATERLASIGTLAAGLAHEINNPLAWISGNLGYVLEHLGEPHAELGELRRALEEAQEGVARVSDIVRRLRAFGTPPPGPARARVSVAGEVREALALCRHEVSHRARLEVDVPADLPEVVLGAHELAQALVHLLRNAAQAIPEGRAHQHLVSVRARAREAEVEVEVRDSGAGIAPEVRDRIFEPFFTTRSPREGTGLGLSVCHGLVAAAGGRMEVESEPGRGSCFRVVLPAAAPSLLPGHVAAAPELD